MKKLKIIPLFIFLCSFYAFSNHYTDDKKVRILLIGDSTTEGGKGVFETTIEKIINSQDNTKTVEVINSAKGGETAYSVFESGRYDKEIKGLGKMDYIFVRYGINDFFKRQPIQQNFPGELKNVISHLREDFPKAKIILMTIIPFMNELNTKKVNTLIKEVAQEEKLELFDIYPAYKKGLETYGEHAMNVRFFPLEDIPKEYRKVVRPYTSYVAWKEAKMVRIKTNELDPIFGHLDGWYADRHPNPTGYRLLALETAKFMIPKLKM